jgi:hypothetical protein
MNKYEFEVTATSLVTVEAETEGDAMLLMTQEDLRDARVIAFGFRLIGSDEETDDRVEALAEAFANESERRDNTEVEYA